MGHGNTKILVDRLRPMMQKYKVTAYLSGHDHCLNHFEETVSSSEPPIAYVLAGAGGRSVYNKSENAETPDGALKFYVTDDNKPHGFLSGFAHLNLTQLGMTVSYYGDTQELLFRSRLFPPRSV